jgi:NhaA family Na+:H+ antiporter
MPIKAIREFLKYEAAGGILLAAAAAVALVVANTPLHQIYQGLLDFTINIPLGQDGKYKSVLLLINDGLMAVFFLLIGLELKREILDGELSRPSQIILPAFAAAGGMLIPAIVFALFNLGDSAALKGWAIPTATDIAFALGVLSVLGSRVPLSLKIFLTALAVLDDIGAIVVIALFYTEHLSVWMLGAALIVLLILLAMNMVGVGRIMPYLIIGGVFWLLVLKSGVHATLAGVALGLIIPLRAKNPDGHSPLRHLEHLLHPWVAFLILPVFAFANAGVRFFGLSGGDFPIWVALGVASGLFLGKQIGVTGATFLAIKLGLAKRPGNVSWRALHGISCLCGIGFTMSLFVGNLAFKEENLPAPTTIQEPSHVVVILAPPTESSPPNYDAAVKIGVIGGSLISGLLGFVLIATGLPPSKTD